MITNADLINILNENPKSECQIELDTLSDEQVSIEEVAKGSGREVKIIDSVKVDENSSLALYERWVVFLPKDE